MDTAIYTGVGLCAVAALRGVGAAIRWVGECRRERQEFLKSLAEFEAELDRLQTPVRQAEAAWKGYRRFVVQHVVDESVGVRSLYLVPEDRRPLPPFVAGQFLTLRITVPGMSRPAVRCYSLSDRPRPDGYRITVKVVPRADDPNLRSNGLVSRFLNRAVNRGQILEVQAPRGEFQLQEDARPAVLIAAGIGITPLLSMAAMLLHEPIERKIILFYGVRNSREHPFENCLREYSTGGRLHYLPCYSQPLAEDRHRKDVILDRRADVALVRQTLPDPDFPFYICGPGSFMQEMVAGLLAWGAAERDLHYEAFGPSTIKRNDAAQPESAEQPLFSEVTFRQSDVTVKNRRSQTLLDLAESHGLNLPSGCRSGNCGMCAARLLAGQVRYDTLPAAPVDPGFCLTCVARPDAAQLTLDA